MTREEIRKVFDLLTEYYPRAKQLKSPNGQAAWILALEKFPYEPVKNAVVLHATRSKFFPDVADITAELAAPAESPRRTVSDLEREAVRRLMERKEEPSAQRSLRTMQDARLDFKDLQVIAKYY